MPDIRIRTYRKGDFPAISRLWDELGLGGRHRGDDEVVIERTLCAGGVFFVMCDGDSLIGTAWITNDQRRLHLHHMGVEVSHQNKGFGMRLLRRCLDWCREQGLQTKLEVHVHNPGAIHLYEKAGFQRLGDYDVYVLRPLLLKFFEEER